jgi:hypothetical protein
MNIIYESDGYSNARRWLLAEMTKRDIPEDIFEESWAIIRDGIPLSDVKHRFSADGFSVMQIAEEMYRDECGLDADGPELK